MTNIQLNRFVFYPWKIMISWFSNGIPSIAVIGPQIPMLIFQTKFINWKLWFWINFLSPHLSWGMGFNCKRLNMCSNNIHRNIDIIYNRRSISRQKITRRAMLIYQELSREEIDAVCLILFEKYVAFNIDSFSFFGEMKIFWEKLRISKNWTNYFKQHSSHFTVTFVTVAFKEANKALNQYLQINTFQIAIEFKASLFAENAQIFLIFHLFIALKTIFIRIVKEKSNIESVFHIYSFLQLSTQWREAEGTFKE